ncbi:DUF4251 domain-containing protein [Psychroflexus sp. ALD_RP9]|uniref:DUF4251 domain-containing protein n=1 Tax=Psychroflexus sp. ALD_RP9 TaxID=2777186 RepID=UPI001A8E97AE|nr:DUF4251 domain-containing protein [Psychroflexus sp. ALD_RP9]QSS97058.1 DUF4251 domain-containing protein [Psychroflexus sp. ALD_RP9]
MKYLKFIGVIIIISFIQACASSSIIATEEQKAKLEQIINDESFNIESKVAYPMPSSGMNAVSNLNLLPFGSSANRIDISMTANHIKFLEDSIDINLPYYGERQLGNGYSNENGINVQGKPKHVSIDYNESKKRYRIKFEAKNKTESLNFDISIYHNLKTSVRINSSDRTSIRFDGNVKMIED